MTGPATVAASGARVRITLAVCMGLALLYAWLAARSFEASRLASSLDIPALQRAVAIAPQDAAYHNLLCRFLLFDKQDADAALPHCRRATELNAHQSAYWLDLALAQFSTGATDEQRQSILNAVAADPMTPDVAYTAASFFLTQGETAPALREFAVAMRGDPNMVQPAVNLCWRTWHNPAAIEAMLPPLPAAHLYFIRLLAVQRQWDAAQQAWTGMLQSHAPIDYRQAMFYIDALLDQHEAASAQRAWDELASHSALLNDYGRADGAVLDGGFEKPLLNSGFGWRYSPQNGSTAALDPDEFHSGRQSLVIAYNGTGGDAGILQYLPVKPHSQYTVSAWVKSERLDAANGPVIVVSDAYADTALGRTQETLGTTGWHQLDAVLHTGPQTELVAIRIARDPGSTHISGKFWVDDVTLRASNTLSAGR